MCGRKCAGEFERTDKRRQTAVKKIKVGDTVLCRQECKNRLTPRYDPVPMVIIGVKGSMITARNSQKIRSKNYADWKLLKNGYRESVWYGEPCPVPPQEVTNDAGAAESAEPEVANEPGAVELAERPDCVAGARPHRKIISTKDTILLVFT